MQPGTEPGAAQSAAEVLNLVSFVDLAALLAKLKNRIAHVHIKGKDISTQQLTFFSFSFDKFE